MTSFLSPDGGDGGGEGKEGGAFSVGDIGITGRRQHPLLLWLDQAGYEGSPGVPLFLTRYYWLSLGAYYILLFACAWFVLQWFRRGHPWTRARSFLVGKSKGEQNSGVGVASTATAAVSSRDGKPSPPQLRYVDSPRNRRLLDRTTVLRQPYVPSPWLGHRLGGHMQSFMFATWCPPRDRLMVSRLVSRQDQVESSFDGGVFRMDWFDLREKPLPADAPVVFVLPGVVGQGTNVYIRHLAAHLSTKYGWRVVTKNWRGIGLGLSTRRPETWDHVALSDSRDAVRHIRKTVGRSVPILGVGFSFGGCMLTAIAGSVPQEEHGLRGLVSISGLFDMSAMMTHIAEQYAYPYGFANTKVTVKNYRKFKVLETLTAEVDVNESGTRGRRRSSGVDRLKGDGCSDDSIVGLGSSSSSASSSSWSSAGLMQRRKRLPPTNAGAPTREKGIALPASSKGIATGVQTGGDRWGGAGAGAGATATATRAPSSAFSLPVPLPTTPAPVAAEVLASGPCSDSSGAPSAPGALQETPAMMMVRTSVASSLEGDASGSGATAVAAPEAAEVGTAPTTSDGKRRDEGINHEDLPPRCDGVDAAPGAPGAGAGVGAGVVAGNGFVTAKEMAALKGPYAFHEALTLPFTGDATVEAYFRRIERVMSKDVSSVTVPTLCLLAKDDPLCPPLAWVGALEAAAKSDGIVVAITNHGGHCGWFDGLGAGSWLDRAAGDFLATALELSKEERDDTDSPRGQE